METTTEKPDTQVKQEMWEQHTEKKTERRFWVSSFRWGGLTLADWPYTRIFRVWFGHSTHLFHCIPSPTDKKEKKIFLIYKEIQKRAVAKSYKRKGFQIYEEIFCELLGCSYLYMTLQLLPSEFSYIWGKLSFIFTFVWLLPAMAASSAGGGWRQQAHASHDLRIPGTKGVYSSIIIQSMCAPAVTNMRLTLISVVSLSSGCVAEARRWVQEDRHQLWRQQPQQQPQQQARQQHAIHKLSLPVNLFLTNHLCTTGFQTKYILDVAVTLPSWRWWDV